jgi:hypothetical protein
MKGLGVDWRLFLLALELTIYGPEWPHPRPLPVKSGEGRPPATEQVRP